MRILRNIIITLLLLVLAAVSVVGLMVEFPPVLGWTPERVNQLGHSFVDVMRPRHGLLWLWSGLAGGCLLVLLITVFRRRKPMRIEVQMGGGRVVILDSAIKRYIRSALSELHGVTVKRINLRETRSGISTEIYADVKTQESLPVLERRMIQRVRAALAEDLGITSISDVHVFIRDFEVSGRSLSHHREGEEGGTRGVTAATGPFDQVPVPVSNRAAETMPEERKKDEVFFTPKPAHQQAVLVTEPEEFAVLNHRAKEAAAAVVDASPPEGEEIGGQAVAILDEPKPKRRGLFGLGRAAEEPATSDTPVPAPADSAEDSPQELTYNPATSAEGMTSDSVPSTEAEASSHSDELMKPVEGTGEGQLENRS